MSKTCCLRHFYASKFGCVIITHYLCTQNLTKSIIMFTYKYPHPAVTTDSVIFGFDGSSINILLIERGGEPFKGAWALPGGFIHMDETVEEGARRELREETNIQDVYLEQFHIFSDVNRDPRERILSVAFFALVSKNDFEVIAGDDASKAQWHEWNHLPPLAFDHAEIIRMARERLQEKLRISPIAFKLLGSEFKMDELQRIYELIHEKKYDRRNFMRKMESSGFLNKMEIEDEVCCMMLPDAMADARPSRAFYTYSFDEEAFNKANASKEWRKYPFDF